MFSTFFCLHAAQETLFVDFIQPRLAGVWAGTDLNIIAYGATGTGKTFTLAYVTAMEAHTRRSVASFSMFDNFVALALTAGVRGRTTPAVYCNARQRSCLTVSALPWPGAVRPRAL